MGKRGPKAKLITHCKECGVELDVTNSIYIRFSRLNKCKSCNNEYQKKYYHENYSGNKEHIREGHLRVRFGITAEDYNKLLELQSGGCAICKQSCLTGRRLAVDHNHETNEIRGLLCNSCNAGIGHFKEDENLLLNAIEYLKRTTWNKKEIA